MDDDARPGPRRVLVTGGASGLGAALAARFAARGDRVLVTDLAPDADVPAGAVYQRLDITSQGAGPQHSSASARTSAAWTCW
jgi:NAD(P)-dependent dehydrogenase (short-subunit alcohol dehydrogenase family)